MISLVNRRAALFLLLYLAAILYLSLYPWTFVSNPGPTSLTWVPLDTRRAILDAFLNVVFYMPLGAAAFQHETAILRAHANEEPMRLRAMTRVGLKSPNSLSHDIPSEWKPNL